MSTSSEPRRRFRRLRGPLAAAHAALVAALVVTASAAAAKPKPLPPPESEGDLAKRPEPYLVVDRERALLEIKVKGLVVRSLPVSEVAFQVYRPIGGEAATPAVPLPAIWTVSEAPLAPYRALIAPAVLTEDGQEATEVPEAAEAREAPRPPERYEVPLEGGWTLLVGAGSARPGVLGRWRGAVSDGWQTLKGDAPERPPRLVVVVADADARFLHHLFRAGAHLVVR